jgi:HipA-like C-terminal domain
VLRTAFAAFDKSRNKGLLLIDEAQVLADRQHRSLEIALSALLDTRKDRSKVIFTGSSEDRLRTMFGLEGGKRLSPASLRERTDGARCRRHVWDRARWSYLLLADELRRRSRRPPADLLELFRRMVFNALISNTDDHPCNHGLIATNAEWVPMT